MQKSSSILLLSGCVLMSMAIGIGISLLVSHFLGLTPLAGKGAVELTLQQPSQWYIRMLAIGIEHGFTFLVPGIFFWYVIERKTWEGFSRTPFTDVSSLWISMVVIVALIPVNQLIIQSNQNIQLPDFFEAIESWMHAKEQEKISLTKGLLEIHLLPELFVALTIFGLLGPIGEEIFFRGVLQVKLNDWGLTPVKSIWAAAVIFSLIHFQFYGFFPRLLLGALFGYLFLWSGNIWIPILAHIVNNSFFVLAEYSHQNWPILDRNLTIVTNHWLSQILSLILSVSILFLFRSKNFKPRTEAKLRT